MRLKTHVTKQDPNWPHKKNTGSRWPPNEVGSGTFRCVLDPGDPIWACCPIGPSSPWVIRVDPYPPKCHSAESRNQVESQRRPNIKPKWSLNEIGRKGHSDPFEPVWGPSYLGPRGTDFLLPTWQPPGLAWPRLAAAWPGPSRELFGANGLALSHLAP